MSLRWCGSVVERKTKRRHSNCFQWLQELAFCYLLPVDITERSNFGITSYSEFLTFIYGRFGRKWIERHLDKIRCFEKRPTTIPGLVIVIADEIRHHLLNRDCTEIWYYALRLDDYCKNSYHRAEKLKTNLNFASSTSLFFAQLTAQSTSDNIHDFNFHILGLYSTSPVYF